jgi:hypothetical protein
MDTQTIENKLETALGGSSKRKLKITVTDGKEFNQTVEGLSLKKIIKGLQGSLPKGTQYVNVQYTNRKGNSVDRDLRVPIGRKKKIGK